MEAWAFGSPNIQSRSEYITRAANTTHAPTCSGRWPCHPLRSVAAECTNQDKNGSYGSVLRLLSSIHSIYICTEADDVERRTWRGHAQVHDHDALDDQSETLPRRRLPSQGKRPVRATWPLRPLSPEMVPALTDIGDLACVIVCTPTLFIIRPKGTTNKCLDIHPLASVQTYKLLVASYVDGITRASPGTGC